MVTSMVTFCDISSLTLSVTISVTLVLFICYFTMEVHDGNIEREFGWPQRMPPVE